MKKLILFLLLPTLLFAQENLMLVGKTKRGNTIYLDTYSNTCYVVYQNSLEAKLLLIKCPYNLKLNKMKNKGK